MARHASPAVLAAAVLGSASFALLFASADFSHARALTLAALPAAFVGALALVTSDRSILFFGALALGFTPLTVQNPLPFSGGASVYVSDLLVIACFASWAIARVLSRPAHGESRQRPAVVSAAFILFAAAIFIGALRGHASYGSSLLGQPLRLIAYAGVGLAIVDLTPRKAYRGIVAVFYAGTVFEFFAALYYLGTGTSQSVAEGLSTGGTRPLSVLTSYYACAALVLALLNLGRDTSFARRACHAVIAALALFEVVVAFSRGTYLTLALVLPVVFAASRGTRRGALSLLPLAVPVIVLGALLVPRVEPQRNEPSIITTLIDRLNPRLNSDINVQFRREADRLLWSQVRENPVFGVGFGRGGTFTVGDVDYRVSQDVHNDFLYLWAGGGIVTLAAFLLVVARFVWLALRRLRSTEDDDVRLIVVWALSSFFVFFANGLVEPLIVLPQVLIADWALLLLPVCMLPSRTEKRVADAGASIVVAPA